ncbi:MAG: hypothetical protein IT236_14940 [Bacteroidia bacterium]|nr:hypothetical protein [Bacteroidia bacterium]
MENKNHTWSFSSVGGVKRVNLESGKDLMALGSLDQKLWTALSCPVQGLEIDSKTLELIDSDGDGRIRVPEILEAVKWITSVINNPDDLLKQENNLPLSVINQNSEEGKSLYASAKQILQNLGTPDATSINVAQTSDTTAIFAKTQFNGDSVITAESCDTADQKKLLKSIKECMGGSEDRSGKKGISEEKFLLFFENCDLFSKWHAVAEADAVSILPFAKTTEAALNAYTAVKSKIDDYFIRCRLADFDAQSAAVLNTLLARYEAISPKDLSTCLDEIATYPIAKISAAKPLPLSGGINPAWEAKLNAFHTSVVTWLFPNKTEITEAEWNSIGEKFVAYNKWISEKAGAVVEQLGIDTVRQIMSGNQKESMQELFNKDKALEKEAANIILVDKLARYYRDIFRLLKNFVTFYDFYSPEEKAIFQNGTLFIDQRSCDLCIKVSDMDKHSTMVSLSGMYLIYCDCVSKSKDKKMTIVAAMTNGDIDNLIVGRNAVFYDRDGLDWDATVTKIVENPISIRQAFFSPYRKVARFIETQVEKFASAKEKEGLDKATAGVEEAGTKVATVPAAAAAPAPAPTPFDIGKFVGIFAALSLALGAIGGVLASLISGLLGLKWWQMPLAVLGIILAISGPSMIIAWLKLRKRNLAPILDANGWAINARAIINIPFGNTLTNLVKLPANARINLNDPFKKKKNPLLTFFWILLLIVAIATVYLWKMGYLATWFGAN